MIGTRSGPSLSTLPELEKIEKIEKNKLSLSLWKHDDYGW